jgi:hypothetical protein
MTLGIWLSLNRFFFFFHRVPAVTWVPSFPVHSQSLLVSGASELVTSIVFQVLQWFLMLPPPFPPLLSTLSLQAGSRDQCSAEHVYIDLLLLQLLTSKSIRSNHAI